MTDETLMKLDKAEKLLDSEEVTFERPEDNRLDAYLPLTELLDTVQRLHEQEWGYLASITGVDPGPETGELEAIYHLCSGAAVLGLRTRVPRENAKIPSVCSIIPSASFFERELSEMFGIEVEGTPVAEKLFLPEDWPDDIYPLRKDYTVEAAKQPGEG